MKIKSLKHNPVIQQLLLVHKVQVLVKMISQDMTIYAVRKKLDTEVISQ